MDSEYRKLDKIIEKFCNSYEAIFFIDTEKEEYETLKSSEQFNALINRKGNAIDVYKLIFFNSAKGNVKEGDNDYERFIDMNVFKKDFYHTKMKMYIKEVEVLYMVDLMKISNNESVILLRKEDELYLNDELEKKKVDAIQENYLFSMIVNLKDDTCQSSVTTELRSSRQDYLDIKYSEWRYAITNMFMQNDKSMFLSMSEPAYIIQELEKNKQFHFELQMMNMQGEFIWVRLSFTRMQGFSRQNPEFVYTVQDINEDMLRLLNQENIIQAVEEQNEQLIEANKTKNVFISNMSHEIRTPINAVLGMDEMIIRETTEDNIRSYAYDIKNAGKMLLSIINDILDFSKIEAGKMEIIPTEYNLVSMINDVYNMISNKAKEKSLDFAIEIDSDLPTKLYGDEIRIEQVLINILTNAVKYTQKGSISFEMSAKKYCDDEVEIFFRVKDTGIGMRKEDIGKLCNAFERIEEKRNRNIEGTGLGMSIVVRLLEQMGSKLEIDSVYGEGSTFSFTLIQKIVDKEPIGDFKEAQKKIRIREEKRDYIVQIPKAKALVVDDNYINLKVMEALLKETKMQVDCAEGGQECLEKMKANSYNVVFLDHFMPDMDGIETLHHIKELDEEISNIPIIALTANVMSGAKERYINAGFTDFLEKPIMIEKLEEMLLKYIPAELFEK